MQSNIQLKKYEIVKLDYRNILPLQEDLKDLEIEDEEKFLESLKQNGKFLPEVVWWCEVDKCYYTMDGHARLKTYLKHNLTFDGGYEMDFLEIEADDKQDAAKKILIISSQYHKITSEGLINFSEKFGLDIGGMSNMISLTGFGNLSFIENTKKLKGKINSFSSFGTDYEQDDLDEPLPESEGEQDFDISQYIAQSPSDEESGYVSSENEPIKPLTEGGKQKASSDFASINEIVSVETKQSWNEIIEKLMQERGLEERGLAIAYLVESY